MSKLVSIVMAYYNRLPQLKVTLETISLSSRKKDIEVIIVDDASDEGQRADQVLNQFGLDIKYHYNKKEEKTWTNPCHSFNIGFKMASGKIVIIQNPECFHAGDIIAHAIKNVKDNYLVYSCKRLQNEEWKKMLQIPRSSPAFVKYTDRLKGPGRWYNHPKYNPRKYHFVSAIARKNLIEAGGFDERYADGYCFDDDEFTVRMERSPYNLIMVPPDTCFGIHQWHISTLPIKGNKDLKWKKNMNLFKQHTCNETGWRANVSEGRK